MGQARTLRKTILAVLLFTGMFWLFLFFPPEGADWRLGFYAAARQPFQPYEATPLFINPPWMALLLIPFRYLPEMSSLALNSALSLFVMAALVFARKGSPLALFLSLTSYPLLSMIANGNIEWVLALAFLLRNEWSVPLLLLKPQVGMLAVLGWESFRQKWLLFIGVGTVVVGLSFLIWGNWLPGLLSNVSGLQNAQQGMDTWNASFFPFGIPLGVLLILWIFRFQPVLADAEILGVLATLCLVPYFAVYSLGVMYTLISVSKQRIGLVLWVLLWLLPFLPYTQF